MGNHYHLLLDTPRGNLSDAMGYINGECAQSSNWRHGRTGHLFNERFKSLVVPRKLYLKRVSRSIALNPVAAGMVRQPSDWPWSSYRANIGIDTGPTFLYHGWRLWAFDTSDASVAQATYRAYVDQGIAASVADDVIDELKELSRARYRDRIVPRTCEDRVRPSLEDLLTPCRWQFLHATCGSSKRIRFTGTALAISRGFSTFIRARPASSSDVCGHCG
jgi:hypothetical protein